MASMDVFKGDAFSMIGLGAAIENIDHKPQLLGSLNIFDDDPVDTRVVMVESRDNELELIPTSPIGAPLVQLDDAPRKVRNFMTSRLAKGSRIYAESVQNIRAFGSTTELEQVQAVVVRRLSRLVDDLELTWERMRLGAVQGLFYDGARTQTLVNYFDEFGVAPPSDVPFAFDTLAAGELRPLIEGSIVRPIVRAAKSAVSSVVALCGDEFWDKFINHEEVRQTYLNWQAAAELRGATAFGSFSYAGVDWYNYRGTDDNSTVAIASDEAKFFPRGARDVFKVCWGPAEFFDAVNQPGVPVRALTLPDPSGRNAFVDVEVYSYPLFLCTKPQTLRKGTLAT